MVEHFYACDGELTFEKLSQIIEKYKIPHDVTFLSDSGWECCATSMRGVRYCEEDNAIVFTQDNGYSYQNMRGETEYKTSYATGYKNLTL